MYGCPQSLLTLVSSIMNTKARHAAYINSIQKLNPWGTAFEVRFAFHCHPNHVDDASLNILQYPLSLNMSFNIIGTFIHRGTCPKTNDLATMLPVGVYDVAVITFLSTPIPAASVDFTLAYLPGPIPDVLFAAFVTGTDTYYSEVAQAEDGGMSVVVPEGVKAKGAVYVLLVTPDEEGKVGGDVVEANVFAGPGLAMFPFRDEGKEAKGGHEGEVDA